MEIKKVKVYVEIAGNYCAFHAMMFNIVYDVTNGKQIGEYSLEELENWEYDEYVDCQLRDAIIVDGKYYVKW